MVAALALSRISKRFGGFAAIDDVDFAAASGEVHALLGENGAGKSSLMNVAAGLYAPDSGTICVHGQACRLSGPRDATRHGIGMIHQHFKLVRGFTVAENILLANPRGPFRGAQAAIRREIVQQAERLGFKIDPDRRVDSLSIAEQQRVEILKVLVGGASILILDEPTAVLTEQEAQLVLRTMREIADQGAAVILVTHKLRDVRAAADRVTVMRKGRVVTQLDPARTSAEELTRLTIGADIAAPSRTERGQGRVCLSVTGLRSRRHGHPALDGVTLAVREGEIFAVAGVGGNGQTELLETLCGALPLDAGVIEAGAGPGGAMLVLTQATARNRLGAGLAFVPADRQRHALASSLPIADNLALGFIGDGRFGPWHWVDRGAIRRFAEEVLSEADVQGVRTLSQGAGLLSGGNAQKLVLAREFARAPKIIVTHSPSRGLDAKACAAVQRRLVEARNAGAAVLLISEDLDEVMAIADRVGVMAAGRIVAEFAAPCDRQAVGRAMVDHG